MSDIDKLLDDSKEGRKLESRRFSMDSSTLDTSTLETRDFANLNLNQLIGYLGATPKNKLRILYQSLRKYLNSKGDPDGIINDFISSELAKIILEGKSEIEKNGGNLTKILNLAKYGPEVSKAGNKLNRIINRIIETQKTSGFIPKNLQELLNSKYKDLLKGFKENFFSDEESEDYSETVTQSNTEDTNLELRMNNDHRVRKLETELYESGVVEYDQEVDKDEVRFLFKDPLDKELAENIMNHER